LAIVSNLPAAMRKIPASRRLMPVLFLFLSLAALHIGGSTAWAVTCTTQGQMSEGDRESLMAVGSTVAGFVASQNHDQLQASLLPAVLGDWEAIRGVAQGAAPLLKGGELHWRNAYLLDATDIKGSQDTQFFCTNADSTLTVAMNLRSLPPGKYALMIADFTGAPLAGQLALILGSDPSAAGKWKLGGIFAHEGVIDGHDGIWYWNHARELAGKKVIWSAWFDYDAARLLLLPVDFVSSPNLEKLNREQAQLGPNPAESLPLTVAGGSAVGTASGKSWKIKALRLDTTLHAADLGLTYEGTGITDPVAARAEAVAVMSGLLKLHPELRDNFHGVWAYAERDGKQSYAMELAMHDIP
jgi:hypothetical protein